MKAPTAVKALSIFVKLTHQNDIYLTVADKINGGDINSDMTMKKSNFYWLICIPYHWVTNQN